MPMSFHYPTSEESEALLSKPKESALKDEPNGRLVFLENPCNVASEEDEVNQGCKYGTMDTIIQQTPENKDPLTASSTPKKIPWKQITPFILLLLGVFCGTCCGSLQAPFYPIMAERKGATPTEYGFVFGIFQFVNFITSLFAAKYISCIGAKFLFNCGILITGVSTCLFGILQISPPGDIFLALSFAIRIVSALGDSGVFNAGYVLSALLFPDSVAIAYSFFETSYAVGLIVGPTIGAIFYDIDGFYLPFVAMGAITFVVGIICCFILSPIKGSTKSSSSVSFFRVLRSPCILVATFAIIASAVSLGFLNTTLEPFLSDFTTSPMMMGLMFVVTGASYAVTSPIWGWMCDRMAHPTILCCLGAFLAALSLLFVAPIPVFHISSNLWLTAFGLAFHGVAIAGEMLAGCFTMTKELIVQGYPDTTETHGLVAGLFNANYALGAFLGPSIGGALFDAVGFAYGTLVMSGIHLVVVAAILVFLAVSFLLNPKKTENKPLLSNKSKILD